MGLVLTIQVMRRGELLGQHVFDSDHHRLVKVGKRPTDQISVTDETVHSVRARITLGTDEALLLDLGTTGGIAVNGFKVREAQLKANDQVQIGQTTLLVTGCTYEATGVGNPFGEETFIPTHSPGASEVDRKLRVVSKVGMLNPNLLAQVEHYIDNLVAKQLATAPLIAAPQARFDNPHDPFSDAYHQADDDDPVVPAPAATPSRRSPSAALAQGSPPSAAAGSDPITSGGIQSTLNLASLWGATPDPSAAPPKARPIYLERVPPPEEEHSAHGTGRGDVASAVPTKRLRRERYNTDVLIDAMQRQRVRTVLWALLAMLVGGGIAAVLVRSPLGPSPEAAAIESAPLAPEGVVTAQGDEQEPEAEYDESSDPEETDSPVAEDGPSPDVPSPAVAGDGDDAMEPAPAAPKLVSDDQNLVYSLSEERTLAELSTWLWGSARHSELLAARNAHIAGPDVAISPGTEVRIPRFTTVTVASGETLGTVAQATLGEAKYYEHIHAHNRELLPTPDAVEVGMKLTVPLLPRDIWRKLEDSSRH